MAAAVRLIAFLASALGLEIVRGPGALVVALAALVGLARRSSVFVALLVVAGIAASLGLPDEGGGAGKVSHGLSNAPFVALLYVVLGALGYAAGRLTRAVNRRSRRG